MSKSYIDWRSLSEGERENLCKAVCQRILEQPGVADRFELEQDKLFRTTLYRLKSKHGDSSVTVAVYENADWPRKAGVYVKRNDGYGNGQTQTIRFHLKSDQSFNVEKVAARACELDQVSIDHAIRRREDKVRRKHAHDLKKLVSEEIAAAIYGTAYGTIWKVEDYWDSIKIRLDGNRSTCITVGVTEYAMPTVKVEFPFEAEPEANAKLLRQINEALGLVAEVIEGATFQAAFANKPTPVLA